MTVAPCTTETTDLEAWWDECVKCENTTECPHPAAWRRRMFHDGTGKLCTTRAICDTCKEKIMRDLTEHPEPRVKCRFHQVPVNLVWSPL